MLTKEDFKEQDKFVKQDTTETTYIIMVCKEKDTNHLLRKSEVYGNHNTQMHLKFISERDFEEYEIIQHKPIPIVTIC